MEAPRFVLSRQRQRCTCLGWISGLVVVCMLAVVVIPTSVVVWRKDRKYPDGLPATVLIPLYEYPATPYVWDPLHEAYGNLPDLKEYTTLIKGSINSTRDLKFVVIINPDSGPGYKDLSPPADFVPQIQRLNDLPNVQTVGYVRTGYGDRPIDEIARDVETYSSWSSINTSLAMSGIFFDEVAYEFSEDNYQHLLTINAFAKNSTGIREPRTVIHNPGVVPDARLNVNNTDITVTFEQSLKQYRKLDASLRQWPLGRSSTAYMVHSARSVDLKQFVPEISYRAEYLFVTSNKKDYYGNFGDNWQKFVAAMPTKNTTAT